MNKVATTATRAGTNSSTSANTHNNTDAPNIAVKIDASTFNPAANPST